MNTLKVFLPIAAVAVLALLSLSAHATCRSDLGASATPNSAFIVNGNGTVTHISTGLMWKQCDEGLSGATCAGTSTTMTWSNALLAAKNSTFAGYTDWRLPNKQELESLLDDTCILPAINNTVFPNTYGGWTWTGTTYSRSPANAWIVRLDAGNSEAYAKTQPFDVRLVRGGQSFDALAPDTTGPGTSISAGPSSSSATTATISFTATGTVAVTGFECRLDGAAFAACTSPVNLTGLALGSHTFQVRAKDAVGNVDATPATVTWRVLPVCSLDIDGANGPTAEVDAVIISRFLAGVRGNALHGGLTPLGLRNSGTLVESYIGTGAQFDVVGRAVLAPIATIDGLILTRLMRGFPDTTLLTGVTVPPGAQFTTAAQIRADVNARCGTSY
jgi:hypothetical protein